MKIRDIKQQVKRQDRYSIFADGKYVFSLSEGELVSSGLRIGREYSAAEFEELQKTAIEDKAYSRSLDLLSRRARSEWELREYLKRKEYQPETIEHTIVRLAERGYVNDKQFAESWVNTRRLLKATSKRKLSQELKQKRIREEIIAQVLAEDQTDERQVLYELIAKKRTQTRYQDEQKLIAYLLRQGFNYQDVKDALNHET